MERIPKSRIAKAKGSDLDRVGLDMVLLSSKLLSRQYDSENFTVATVTTLTTVIKMLKNPISIININLIFHSLQDSLC